jgi:hypothetical protein
VAVAGGPGGAATPTGGIGGTITVDPPG